MFGSLAARSAALCLALLGLPCLPVEPEPAGIPAESAEELHAAAGKDVLLNCSCRQPANITALNWLRLHMSDYVLFYRDNHPYNDYQHPQYRGRVRLVDPQVANRNLSIVLSNVSTQDAGTYWCRVGLAGGEEASTFIDLKVAPPLSGAAKPPDVTT